MKNIQHVCVYATVKRRDRLLLYQLWCTDIENNNQIYRRYRTGLNCVILWYTSRTFPEKRFEMHVNADIVTIEFTTDIILLNIFWTELAAKKESRVNYRRLGLTGRISKTFLRTFHTSDFYSSTNRFRFTYAK